MPAGLIDPVAEYDHTAPHGAVEQGEAIIGGFVYRGSSIPALAGKYVFGDYSRIFGQPDGRLFYLCASPDVTNRVCAIWSRDQGLWLRPRRRATEPEWSRATPALWDAHPRLIQARPGGTETTTAACDGTSTGSPVLGRGFSWDGMGGMGGQPVSRNGIPFRGRNVS